MGSRRDAGTSQSRGVNCARPGRLRANLFLCSHTHCQPRSLQTQTPVRPSNIQPHHTTAHIILRNVDSRCVTFPNPETPNFFDRRPCSFLPSLSKSSNPLPQKHNQQWVISRSRRSTGASLRSAVLSLSTTRTAPSMAALRPSLRSSITSAYVL